MLKLFNTLTRKVQPFRPIKKTSVSFYACGPTVYNYPHIGNLRTYINEDLLRRTLKWNGFRVDHVMNITDVGHLTSNADTGDDKIELGAKREKKTVQQIIAQFTDAFLENLDELHILRPSRLLRATETIPDQIQLVQTLEQKGYTYRTSDGIYFDTSKFSSYARLARLDLKGLQEGARINKNVEKRHPTDFALWKFSNPKQHREQEWPSPWGVGFPGWHVECSAMTLQAFGPTTDVHAGGIDHIPVHHTNEIAQSEAATGKPFVRFWMHTEFLLINNGRMGKSQGNFIPLATVKQKNFDPLAYRLFCMGAHYRSKLNFSWGALTAAQTQLEKLRQRMRKFEKVGRASAVWVKRFERAINDDLQLPQALAIVWDMLKSPLAEPQKAATLLQFDEILGLGFKEEIGKTVSAPAKIQQLLKLREAARTAKDFKTADQLRAQIEAKGFLVEDTPSGPELQKKS